MDRDELLARHRTVHAAIEQRDWDDPGADLEELRRLVDERLSLRDRYRELLVEAPLTRCPFTDEVVRLDVDRDGLDGLWWNADAPVRRVVGRRSATLVGLVGTIDLHGREDLLPETPFPIKPGPDRPYVIPSVLAPAEVTAVVSTITVATLTARVIAYFVAAEAGGGGATATGAARRTAAGLALDPWTRSTPAFEDRDAALAPWIEADRLLWIAPDDGDLRLQAGSVGCPYLGLGGDDRDALAFEGVLWRLDGADGAEIGTGA